MVTKKDLVIAVLSTFCLTATLFMIISTRGSPSISEYDPLADLTGPEGVPDGVIDMRDISYVCSLFQATGTPIDWTQLLEDVTELQARVTTLEATVIVLSENIDMLEQEIKELKVARGLNTFTGLGTIEITTDFQPLLIKILAFGTRQTGGGSISIGAATSISDQGCVFRGLGGTHCQQSTSRIVILSSEDTGVTIISAEVSAISSTSFTLNCTRYEAVTYNRFEWEAIGFE